MIALKAGGLRIASWMEWKPLQEIPNIPTLPSDHGWRLTRHNHS
jgi:hypothetical protein